MKFAQLPVPHKTWLLLEQQKGGVLVVVRVRVCARVRVRVRVLVEVEVLEAVPQ